MLRQIMMSCAALCISVLPAAAQSTPNLNSIFTDQQLFRACMTSKNNERFCSCSYDVSQKHMKGAKFKQIWQAFLVGTDASEAQRLRSQLTPTENQALNGQLQAADNAQDRCNTMLGSR